VLLRFQSFAPRLKLVGSFIERAEQRAIRFTRSDGGKDERLVEIPFSIIFLKNV
jgi:hypothetical protein